MNYSICATGLAKHFGQQCVLNNVSFNLPTQQISAFLGNNGAGKSTTLRILAGLLKPDAGQVSVFGHLINTASIDYKRQLGCLIDTPAYYGHLSLFDFLKIGCHLKQLRPQAALDALRFVDILDAKDKRINTCSLGMKQRVCLAFAILGFPKLLLLDEPTNGLDPQGRAEFRSLLQSLPQQHGCSVFLSSHLLDDVEKLADHIVVINQGKITTEGPISKLLSSSNTLHLTTDNPFKTKTILLQHRYQVKDGENGTLLITHIAEHECVKLHQLIFSHRIGLYHSSLEKLSLDHFLIPSTHTSEAVNGQIIS